jgi:glycosyltransferase involved in cell wall biosynthesis
MPRAIIVVPCYNEARRLNMRAIQDYGRRTEIAELLFVDDGSRDETPDLLAHLHRNNPRRFSYINLQPNGGKAEAVRQGVLAALQSNPDYVGFWDADLATPLADIESFARVLDQRPDIEMVIGTRMRLLGHRVERQRLRYWLGRLFANTASLALGVRVFDTQCGAKLFRATPSLPQLFARPFLTRWIFDVEILARLAQLRRGSATAGLRQVVYELPLDSWHDVAGSTLKRGDFAKAIGELAKIYWTYLRPGAKLRPVPPPSVLPEPRMAPHGDQKAA